MYTLLERLGFIFNGKYQYFPKKHLVSVINLSHELYVIFLGINPYHVLTLNSLITIQLLIKSHEMHSVMICTFFLCQHICFK